LEDDRRAGFELLEHAPDVGGAGERRRPPGKVDGVVVDLELGAFLDEPESREADAARADEPLDVGEGQEVVEAALLRPRDDKRLLLPVLGEKLLRRDRVETASES
jgi:hypothetical protein